MDSKLALVNKLICIKDLMNEKGVVFSKRDDIWNNTYYGTLNTVRLVRMRKNGIPEWLTIPHDLLLEHFEEYKF